MLGGVRVDARAAQRQSLLSGAAGLAVPVLWQSGADGHTAARAEPAAALHGLFWLVSNLAEREPLMLVVDDAHWADHPSLRFLAYLARRLSGLAGAGARTAERGSGWASRGRAVCGRTRARVRRSLPRGDEREPVPCR